MTNKIVGANARAICAFFAPTIIQNRSPVLQRDQGPSPPGFADVRADRQWRSRFGVGGPSFWDGTCMSSAHFHDHCGLHLRIVTWIPRSSTRRIIICSTSTQAACFWQQTLRSWHAMGSTVPMSRSQNTLLLDASTRERPRPGF